MTNVNELTSISRNKTETEKEIEEIFAQDKTPYKSGKNFRVSDLGCCWRKRYMELKELYKEKIDSKLQRIFDMGNNIHEMIFKELAEKHGDYKIIGAEVNIPDIGKRISGRCDLILSKSSNGEIVICDIKSCGKWTMDKAKEGIVDDNYKSQVNMYVHLFQTSMKIKTGVLILVDKTNGDIEIIEIPYDKQLAESQIKEVTNFFDNFVDKNICPEKCINP
ncbi:MAG TPA: hypothetical protein ENH06_00745, partial [bacterium]|nr:hypothetical protein [bacterium]